MKVIQVLRKLQQLEDSIRELREAIAAEANAEATPTAKRSTRPESEKEVCEFIVVKLKLTEEDALALWEHWVGNGFKNNGRAMADWKAVASNWERRGMFFPSLQPNGLFKK